MRRTVIVILAIMIVATGFSQTAYEGSITYDKKKQQAFVIDYNYSPDAVENAIVQKMEKMGYKTSQEKGIFNKNKGFYVYKSIYINDISSKSMDYIIKVESKGKKSDGATLYLVVNKDGEDAINSFDGNDMNNAKNFLNNLLPDVEAANLELQIKAQEDVLAKAQKKFKNLQNDKEDMEKKIRKLQDDIRDNVKSQEDTQKDIDAQQQALDNLRLKRRA